MDRQVVIQNILFWLFYKGEIWKNAEGHVGL